MDIRSNGPWPASALSNFTTHPFQFRGFAIQSMEGLLQGLKFQEAGAQREVFALVGKAAKRKGKEANWQTEQTLWCQGQPLDRHGPEYQDFLDEAYQALFGQNEEAREALRATEDAPLTHRIGKTDPSRTILTRDEFCARLLRIRQALAEDAVSLVLLQT